MSEFPWGFVGAGKMATALAQGWLQAGLLQPEQLAAYDPLRESGEQFSHATGARLAVSNAELARACGLLVLAVKPQQIPAALAELRTAVGPQHLILSVAAGCSLAALEQGLGDGPRIVRVMPNTPCLVGQGASAFCLGRGTTADDAALVQKLLTSVGRAWQAEEKLFDAVTGLSGSGPAYVYVLIEALSDGGVRMGLPREVATGLAAQTVLGAAQMVLQTGAHPGVLKEHVTSPGGTTIAGLQSLEQAGFRGALMAAVEAATRRSVELRTSS